MAKNIIKEIIIFLLLALAIILILGVLLDDTQVVVTYQIDSTDLNNYKKIQEYVPGKKNPFQSVVTEQTNNTENSNVSSETQGNSTTSANSDTTTNINDTSDTGYLPDKGTK